MALSNENIVKKIQEAVQYHKNGEFHDAVRLYDEVIPFLTGKTAAQICGNAGAIYLQQGDAETAVIRFQQAIEATPENAEPHFNLAVTLNSKLNKQVLAIKHCRLAIKYDPKMHKAYHLMGNILQDIGKPDEAVKYFTLAERIANESLENEISTTLSSSSAETNSLSSFRAYQNLWVWNAQINHTYIFERIGDTWQRRELSPHDNPHVSHTDVRLNDNQSVNILEMTCVSERPLIFEIPILLTHEECNHILSRAEPLLKSSHVMGEGARDDNSDPYRKSANAWLSTDEVLLNMQSRVAILSGLPRSYVQILSEDLQVVKYDASGQFKLHQDSSQFHPRLLTALVYLQNSNNGDAPETNDETHSPIDTRGGETWFPFAPGRQNSEVSPHLESIEEALNSIQDILQQEQMFPERKPERGMLFTPKKGKALLFFNHLADGRSDVAALHSGRKLLEGIKWVANYWIKLDIARLDQITATTATTTTTTR